MIPCLLNEIDTFHQQTTLLVPPEGFGYKIILHELVIANSTWEGALENLASIKGCLSRVLGVMFFIIVLLVVFATVYWFETTTFGEPYTLPSLLQCCKSTLELFKIDQ